MPSRIRFMPFARALLGCGVLGVLGHHVARGEIVPVVNQVNLELHLTGTGSQGCEVEIKPGHPACRFKPIKEKLAPGRTVR